MCGTYKGLVCVASCLSLIQSVIWTGLGIAGALLYLDVITVQPYKNPQDFFRVTLAKLYFEGPKSEIDGNYLGKFNKDYRNINVIDLFWPDKVFAVLVAYIIINVFYFYISFLLYTKRNSNKQNESRRLIIIALEWSCITFLLCAIDVIFAYFLFRDFLQLKDYINKSECISTKDVSSLGCQKMSELPFIPLAMALISGRIVLLWFWNFVMACLVLVEGLCCKESLQSEKEHEQEEKITAPSKPPQVLPPVKLINKSYSTSFDISKDQDSVDIKRSMEAITNFSDDCGKRQECRVYSRHNWDYAPSDTSFRSAAYWYPKLNLKEWNAIKEGYKSDEDKSIVYEKSLKYKENEEPGYKKVKILKPPIGKAVSIPFPPPLPDRKSSSC